MGWYRLVYVYCDVCDEEVDGPTVAAATASARAAGWWIGGRPSTAICAGCLRDVEARGHGPTVADLDRRARTAAE